MKEIITSRHNPIVKHLKALQIKKYRERHGQYFVEGIKMVQEAIAENMPVNLLVISEDFILNEPMSQKELSLSGIDSIILSRALFKEISDVETPQGIAAVITKKDYSIQDLLAKKEYCIVILDAIQDPGNLGSIIRTVDAVAAEGVVLLKGSVDPFNPKTLRSTMGSIFRVPIFTVDDHRWLFNLLKEDMVQIVVSCLKGQNIFNFPVQSNRLALVIGNESRGVKKDIIDCASFLATIPMLGRAESLNASVAAGIMIYEIMRKSGKLGRVLS